MQKCNRSRNCESGSGADSGGPPLVGHLSRPLPLWQKQDNIEKDKCKYILCKVEEKMCRLQKDPLRALTLEERKTLEQYSRSLTLPADQVIHAKEVLAVADGHTFTDAAKLAGRKSGDAVAQLIARFNREGLPALETRHNGGPPFRYTSVECERILREFRRSPDRRLDGTATWSLVTLQRALRRAPDGLPHISTHTIGCVLTRTQATPGKKIGRGVRQVKPFGCVKAGRSRSPIQMLALKKTHRRGVYRSRARRIARLDAGRSWTISDDPLSWASLATRRRASQAAS